MKAYCYIENGIKHFGSFTQERPEEQLLSELEETLTEGTEIYLLTDQDVKDIGSTHPDAIVFDEAPHGYGKKKVDNG